MAKDHKFFRKHLPVGLSVLAMASGIAMTSGIASAASNNSHGIFTETAGWPIPPNYQGNPYASGGVGPTDVLYDNLIQGVRASNQVFYRLAASVTNTATESIVHLRTNDKWSDGQPFTSADVKAVYTLDAQGQQLSNYVTAIDTPNDSTVVFKWIAPYPNNDTRLFLLEQAQMNLPYHYYKTYVDKAEKILASAPKYTGGVQNLGSNFLGHTITGKVQKAWTNNWNAFTKFGPKMPIANGPYMVKTVTPTDMVDVPNPGYWDPKDFSFNTLHFVQLSSGNSNEQYNLLTAGKIDRVDGTPPQNLLLSELKSSQNIVHYQMLDAATLAFVFNQHQPLMQDIKVRQAILYALNRDTIRQASNIYGFNVPWAGVGMPDWELNTYVPKSLTSKMTHYTFDPAKAASLLKSAGWKKANGKWQEPSGKVANLVIACDASWNPQWLNAGEAVAEQLTNFGLQTQFRTYPDSIYFTKIGQKDAASPDMAMDWTDVSWGNTNPWNSLGSYFGQMLSEGGMPQNAAGHFTWTGKTYDGTTVNPYQMLNELPFTKNAAKQNKMIGQLAYAINQNVWTGDLYLNVTGAWFNTKDVTGLPWQAGVKKYNRNVPIPPAQFTGPIAILNEGFSGNIMYTEMKPN